MAPLGSKWIMLIKKMIFAPMKYKAIGIIHPVFYRGEMKARAI